MHQPFIHMMQRSGDRNSCGYAGGPQPFFGIIVQRHEWIHHHTVPPIGNRLLAWQQHERMAAAMNYCIHHKSGN
jgi:hypothetical protein